MVPFENRMMKYGVIRTERLITDLLDWDTLYISGRLHKPVKMLIKPQNPDLIQALKVFAHHFLFKDNSLNVQLPNLTQLLIGNFGDEKAAQH
jgi:hypothetical protein